MAWAFAWQTTDLVWSLWLSSLVVGYAILVWSIFSPLREFITGAARDPGDASAPVAKAGAAGLLLCGSLFGLAFFTVHFGGFHFVHSVFLNSFFPVGAEPRPGMPSLDIYLEVVRRYWAFLPVAFLAERAAFRWNATNSTNDTAVTPAAIARRKGRAFGDGLMAPYKNVIRMHLLIFFFAGVHAIGADKFLVYAVVYAVYFFPWRLWRRPESRPRAG